MAGDSGRIHIEMVSVLSERSRSPTSQSPKQLTPSLRLRDELGIANQDDVRSLQESATRSSPSYNHQRSAAQLNDLQQSREVRELGGGADHQARSDSGGSRADSQRRSCSLEHMQTPVEDAHVSNASQSGGPPVHSIGQHIDSTDSEEGIPGYLSPGPIPDPAHILLRGILQTLQQSTIAGRIDPDLRARFWKCYKNEAEEFHSDFLRKYNGELDISLIFAGLFSAVSGTFVAMMQPNLNADPNATTQVLLMMVVRSLNSSAFAGEALDLPQFTGPDTTTIWVQSLLYASLGASLFAALGAMLGKEWLSRYARVGERGTVEDRCLDRQRKFIAMQAWKFNLVLAFIPLLLQVSLLLFGIALSAYMWSQQRTIASVIIATNVVGVILYVFLILCSLVFPDCPFHTPVTDIVSTVWQYLIRIQHILPWRGRKLHLRRHRLMKTFTVNTFASRTGSRIAQLARSVLAKIMKRGFSSSVTPMPAAVLVTELSSSAENTLSLDIRPTREKQEAKHLLDASCVEWLLVTSTDPIPT